MRYALRAGRIVYPFVLDVEEVNSHLLVDPSAGRALLIDVGEYGDQIRDTIRSEGLVVNTILITHTHYDHVGGLAEAAEELAAGVFVHHRGRRSVGGQNARAVRDGDVFSAGGIDVEVLATEGHTQDSCCYLIGDALFTGDTLFNGSVGGTGSRDLFVQETDNIRNKIFGLPDNVVVFPGHGPPTTVGIERVCNPFF